jgi:pyridoxal phosphate enzyme (YggS family)
VSDVRSRLHQVRERIVAAASAAGRDPGAVQLLVATKTQPPQRIREVLQAGVPLIGENRVQELTAKADELGDLPHEAHLIGPLQGNKVAAALRHASCIQTVDRQDLAERIARRCADRPSPFEVFVQVNVSEEASKSGVAPDRAVELAVAVAALPELRLRGFMTVGLFSDDERAVRGGFARLRGIRDAVHDVGAPGTGTAVELSMGMTGDLEWAIAEGSTMVRVGAAVFGPRGGG